MTLRCPAEEEAEALSGTEEVGGPSPARYGDQRLPMPRPQPQCQTLTIGQLAKRWGVSADRVRKLVLGGQLPGAFTIPSAGRYGATVKVPLATVLQVEADWAVAPAKQAARPKRPRRGDDSGPAFRHFPKLRASLEQPASGSDGAAQD
jgi:hypothetical protein